MHGNGNILIIHTSYKNIVYLCMCTIYIYIYIYIHIFNMSLLWRQSLCGPMPDVGVDLVLPGHPLPEIFDSHLAPCQVKNSEHHTFSTVPRTGGRTKESACKLVVTDIRLISMMPLARNSSYTIGMPAQELPQNISKWNEPSMHCALVGTVFSPVKLKPQQSVCPPIWAHVPCYPGMSRVLVSPPFFKKTIEYYASFTHTYIYIYIIHIYIIHIYIYICHILYYVVIHECMIVSVCGYTHICVYNCIYSVYIYIYTCILYNIFITTTAWSYGVCLTMNPFESLCGLRILRGYGMNIQLSTIQQVCFSRNTWRFHCKTGCLFRSKSNSVGPKIQRPKNARVGGYVSIDHGVVF